MTTARIEVAGLSKSFGPVSALDTVTLTVDAGEVYALLGANGAGKSTLMRCLMGYLNPGEGTVSVLGGSSRAPQIRGRVGYLPGDLRLPPRSKVREIIRFREVLQDRSGHPAADLDHVVATLDLPLDRTFGTLSKGNRQKVGLALALMARPDVVVLDEPTSGLDPLMQDRVLDLVRSRRDCGAAVLLSTHILSEAEAIADRVGVLSHGRLVADAALDALLRRARQSIDLVLDFAPDQDVFVGLPDLVEGSARGLEIHAVVAGSLAPLIARLAPYGVRRISTQAHELDEIFAEASGDSP